MSVCGIQANSCRGLQQAQQAYQLPQQGGQAGGCAPKQCGQSACGQSSVGQKSNAQGADPAKQLLQILLSLLGQGSGQGASLGGNGSSSSIKF
jgi:hypothetical protein